MGALCFGPKSAFRATVILLNPNCHIKKAVNITVKLFKYKAEWLQFTRIGETIMLNHCEMMRIILEENEYLEQAAASIDMSEGANTSAPAIESNEEEDRPIVVFGPP